MVYLDHGLLPQDTKEAKRIILRLAKYSLMEGLLYKRFFTLPHRRYLIPYEAEYALRTSGLRYCDATNFRSSATSANASTSEIDFTVRVEDGMMTLGCGSKAHVSNSSPQKSPGPMRHELKNPMQKWHKLSQDSLHTPKLKIELDMDHKAFSSGLVCA
ncbi:hypothetical protein RJ639_015515 [Escallonia herrerae]|uniref:Uncharacterized protein n=1 Tax=Escallonia herrerae TaxID=1293975 RepID=A0AA88VDH2_9ASTE|nr:hypothetical protein RJ639_015515 [Escallonia herrerae]